jgi:hypothetical protein
MKQFVIPSPLEIQALLKPLNTQALKRLGKLSGVSAATLTKIRLGRILDPGIVTVASFLPHVEPVRKVFVDPETRPLTPAELRRRTIEAQAAGRVSASDPPHVR